MYIPKNKIITNLYTNGLQINNPEGEKYFYIINTNIIYEGYYWKDYKGKFYTGKTPNDKPTQQLIENSVNKDGNNTSYGLQVTLTSTDEFDFNAGESTNIDPFITETYNSLLEEKNYKPNSTLILPTHYYPKPTQEDYKIGAFRRYFCVKANENIFLEIDEKTFKALSTQDDKWRWNLYDPFFVEWVLIGDQSNVRTANFNSSKIIEKIKVGFQKFLRFNYLKFYQPPTKESKITSSTPPPNPTQPNSSIGGY
jgi:hypothetical protein